MMACAKTSTRAEQRALRDKMQAMGVGYPEIAAELARTRGTSVLKPLKIRTSAIRGVTLLVTAAVLLGAACGTEQTTKGTVYGTVYGSGGPATVPPKRLGPSPMKHVTVTVTRAHSGKKFHTVTSNEGAFVLRIPPGAYLLRAECGTARPPAVRVAPGAKVKRNINCQFG
jgi:Carboxypeptidase regulatory-like domain